MVSIERMESKINRLSAKIDTLLEQQKRVISLLEAYLSVYPTQEASNKFFKSVSQGMELAPEIAQEDEEKRLYVLQYLSHVDITKNKQDSQLKKIVWNLSKGLMSQSPLWLPLFITLGALSPLKKK